VNRLVARAEAALLVALGGLGLWFSAAGAYTLLMSPEFRALTAVGAVLILAMGAALLVRPRADPRPAPTVVLAAFTAFAVAATGGARGAGVVVAPDIAAEETRRAGYEAVEIGRLLEDFADGALVADGARVAVTGFVHRTAELDAEGRYALLRPRMACCIADAVAIGVQVEAAPDGAPDEGEWVTVFATARLAAAPIETPPFRIGPILFTVVSATHELVADEAVPVRSLLPDVLETIPAERCGAFLRALEATGVADELRGEGPFTLLCPLDESFEAAAPTDETALAAYLRRFVVVGDVVERDLFGVTELPTLDGGVLEVIAGNGRATVGGARVLFGDQRARNGFVHVVHPALPR
jgi:hypothetical protein